MSKARNVTLMDGQRISRTLKRMAYQLAEDNRSEKEMVLIGIDERGYVTASGLGETLSEIYERDVPVVRWPADGGEPELDIGGKRLAESYVVIVDDVIFSGKTLFDALTEIARSFSLEELHTAVLVDRGHRKFPIQAQFTGITLSTKLNEHVSVRIDDGRITDVVLEIPNK